MDSLAGNIARATLRFSAGREPVGHGLRRWFIVGFRSPKGHSRAITGGGARGALSEPQRQVRL